MRRRVSYAAGILISFCWAEWWSCRGIFKGKSDLSFVYSGSKLGYCEIRIIMIRQLV